MLTLKLAEQELSKYTLMMTCENAEVTLECGNDSDVFSEHFIIDVKEGKGSITANRPRALLLGVYEYLRRCGCRFLRPGEKGEIIPKVPKSRINVYADVRPANRHRGITIEGAVSLENVLDLIEWAPKAGFNSYFIQFRTAFEFFDRWYSHTGNDTLEKQPFTKEDSEAFVKKIIKKIKERDMLYHAVGHGWTTACIGVDGNGWKSAEDSLPEDKSQMLAQIDGKRGYFKGIPLNTNLCYSKREVRDAFVQSVVEYAEEHTEIDVLHLWLADDSNNVCECEGCNAKLLSDWYIIILNEIDRRLTEKGLSVKLCFLVYLDLYWPPEKERLLNEDRFILMFAPIFRSYSLPFGSTEGEALAYEKNKVVYTHDTGTYVRFLNDWKKLFKGDSFDFDYHLMWDINRDFGGETLARVIFEDIRSLKPLGLNGFMSCQIQRAFYPNGLCFYVMGRALFDGDVVYEELRDEYYSAAFGAHADLARSVYQAIEENVPFSFMREESSAEEALPKLKKAAQFTDAALSEFNCEDECPTVKQSLELLKFLLENVKRLIKVLLLKLTGADKALIAEADKDRIDFYRRNELRFQPYTDGFYVNLIVNGIVNSEQIGIYAE